MFYKVGLDIGIASVGWAVIETDGSGEPVRIENMGSRVFTAAEQPKTGASLAAPRREARSARRRLRRHTHRLKRIKFLLEQNGIMSIGEIEEMYAASGFEKDVYCLRYEALDRVLNNSELCRVLINFAQRRGYKSNSRSEEAKQADTGKTLSAISENEKLMREKNYRTVGEMLWLDDKFKYTRADGARCVNVRNTTDDYKFTMPRKLIVDEIKAIFEAQRRLGSKSATAQLEEKYLEIFQSQRNFDEGPGGNSPFGGNMIEKMLGKCTFEKNEPRAVKAAFSFEYFRLLCDLNHIKIKQNGNEIRTLRPDEKEKIINLVFKSDNVNYDRIRRAISLGDEYYFNMVRYTSDDKSESEKKAKFSHMQSYNKMRKALGGDAITALSHGQLDEIARILTLYKNDEKRLAELKVANIPDEFAEPLLSLSFAKAGHLSIKALRKIIPLLEQGMTYDEACSSAYSDFRAHSDKKERKLRLSIFDISEGETITNPVVKRAVCQTLKVLNAITRTYGAPQAVSIELARELSKNHDERKKIEKAYKDNKKNNEKAKEQIAEVCGSHHNVTGLDILKFKLFREQDGRCAYSGEKLEIERLYEPGYVDIDHIIPYSLCFNDSYKNKVLVKSAENRQKGNRIPFDYLGGDENSEKWHQYSERVKTMFHDPQKRERLLKTTLTDEELSGFKSRNLNDTRYITKVVYNLINDNLIFDEIPGKKKHTFSINGAITSYIRKMLGIQKVRADGDTHHAVDAAIIAVTTDGMINRITRYNKLREQKEMRFRPQTDPETGELLNYDDLPKAPVFLEPTPHFADEIQARITGDIDSIRRMHLASYDNVESIKPVFVSEMPRRRISGAAHDSTIRSAKKPGYKVSKTPLAELKLDKKTGEIENYYNPESDTLLYNALKAQLEKFGGDGAKAFTEPFRKPKADGTPGPIVKKVKIFDKTSSNVPVRGGIAKNGGMIRIDIFYVENDGYYFVPIYNNDVLNEKLPSKACVKNKPWKEMDEKDFLFSLYPGELIKVTSRKGITLNRVNKESAGEAEITLNEAFLYYVKAGITAVSIVVTNHDRSFEQPSLGIKTLDLIEKYEVDVLGNYSRVNLPEKRIGFDAMKKITHEEE